MALCNNCISCPYGLTHGKGKKCICGQICSCLSIPKIPLGSNHKIGSAQDNASGFLSYHL